MKKFYLYDTSGEVRQYGECADHDFLLQGVPGLMLAEGHAEPGIHYIDNGRVVELPARPSGNPDLAFDYGTKEWIDRRSLEQVKAARWDYIKQLRTEKLERGFVSQGRPFQSDTEAKTNIIGAAQLAQVVGASFSNTWTCADNTVVVLNSTQMIQVGIDLGTHINTMHGIARSLREQIDAATTATEVEAIEWPTTL